MGKLEFNPELPLDKIDVSKSNVRRTNPEEGLEELAKSIKEIGVQQPVVVFPKGDRYELIIGQRRYLACKKISLKEIPALITKVENETQAAIASFSENIHRLDIEYRDKMQVATELLNKFGGSIDGVAKRLGVSPQTVRNYLGYAAVPEPIKKMVDEKKLSVSTAVRIAKNIPDEKMALKIAEKVMETPSSEKRRILIEVAKENPGKTPEQVSTIADRMRFTRVTIHLTPRVGEALEKACKDYQTGPRDITTDALEKWLGVRGFLK